MLNWEPLCACWRNVVNGGSTLPPGDLRSWRVVLLNAILMAAAVALVVALCSALVMHLYGYALAGATALAGFLAIWIYLRRTGDADGAGIGTVLVTMFTILSVAIGGGTHDFALFWMALFPPVPFFLLGVSRGLFFNLIFGGIALMGVNYGMERWEPAQLNGNALLNIGGTMFGLWIVVFLYELTRAKAQHHLESAANTDFLTALANRRRFLDLFGVEMARAERHGLPLTLLLLDIDRFKRINDLHGHDAGDAVLRQLAAVVRDNLRRSDAVGRLGGDEFGIVLPHTTALQAARVAEKLRAAVEHSPLRAGGEVIPFTISVGVAENGPSRADFSSLFEAADKRLNHAKQMGRNRVAAG